MKPIITVENVGFQGDQIEIGTLVVNNARIGQVKRVNISTGYVVFNFKTSLIESWNKDTTKIFKGKLIMEQ